MRLRSCLQSTLVLIEGFCSKNHNVLFKVMGHTQSKASPTYARFIILRCIIVRERDHRGFGGDYSCSGPSIKSALPLHVSSVS